MKIKLALAYIALLIPSLLCAARVWSCLAPERFYHCWDDIPLFAFIPPFVHPEFPVNSQEFDHFILPKNTVYLVWCCFVAVAALAPASAVLAVGRLWRTCERRGMFALLQPAEPDRAGFQPRFKDTQ